MVDVATLVLGARTDGLLKAESALQKIVKEAGRADVAADKVTVATDRLDAAMGRAAKRSGGFRAGIQNVSYQVQDLAVQMGAGTSATQALGQQLPQLLSGFGMLGVGIGTAAAILVPLAGHFLTAKDNAISLDDAIGNLSDSIGMYEDYISIAATSTDELREKFGGFAGEIQRLSGFMAGIALDQTLTDATAAIEPLKGGLAGIEMIMANVSRAQDQLARTSMAIDPNQYLLARDALGVYKGELEDATSKLGISEDQARRLLNALNDIGDGSDMTALASSALNAQSVMAQIGFEVGRLPPGLQDAAMAIDELAKEAAVASTATAAIDDNAPGSGFLSDAIANARELGSALWGAADAAMAASSQASYAATLASTGQDSGPDAVKSALQGGGLFTPVVRGAGLPQPRLSSRGGVGRIAGASGGGQQDTFASDLERLQQELMTEQQVVEKWHAENEVLLNDRRAREIMGEQAHKEAMLALESEYHERIAAIKEQGNQWSVKSVLDGGAEIFGAMGAINKKFLKAQSVFSAASALISTYQGAAKELEKGTFGFATAAAVIAKGIGFVAAIKGASSGGSSGGGGGGGGGGYTASSVVGVAPVAPKMQERNLDITVNGDGLSAEFARQLTMEIAKKISEERAVGGFV
ncbi:MAG: hypothetical protein U5N55_01525 [Cypionkella sp.]|nr:hypothetical protein [Cypionkella sp.]